MTTTETSTDDQEFRDRAGIEGWLSQHLTEYLWNHNGTLRLGAAEFEVVGGEDVPGYREDENVILIRRKTDGKVFDVEIEVVARSAKDWPPAPAVPEIAGQMPLPGVPE